MKQERINETKQSFTRLLEIMDELRTQCPWDKKQTPETLRILTLEETYELSDAVMEKSLDNIREELGDLMLHLVFYARIGEEKKSFDMKDVLDGIIEKLIVRHPHIYGDTEVADEKEVKDNWEKIKLENGSKTTLGGVPQSLPSMIKAMRIQDKAAGAGFDWDNSNQVWDKVNEELQEFKQEIQAAKIDGDKVENEFGDILFSLVNYARFIKVNPDTALERTNRKFIARFNAMESEIKEMGKSFHDMTLAEMEEVWQRMKGV